MIQFEQETNNGITSIFAIEKDVIKHGKLYDELLYAELLEKEGKFFVVWEDNWQNKIKFDNLEEAKKYVINYYSSHTAHINGRSYEID